MKHLLILAACLAVATAHAQTAPAASAPPPPPFTFFVTSVEGGQGANYSGLVNRPGIRGGRLV